MTERVIIVGGGIAGCAAGFRLSEAGYDVLLLEADSHVGGRMSTTERDGFRIDIGASLLLQNYTAMRRLIADAGLSDEVVAPTSDVTGFVRDQEIHRFPNHSIRRMLTTRYLSPGEKLRAGAVAIDVLRGGRRLTWTDPERARSIDRETARDYAVRRVRSSEVADYLIEPLCAGIAFAPPESVPAIEVLIYLRKVFGRRFFNSATGVQFLPDGLARHFTVETSARVTHVEERPDGVTVTWARHGEPEHTEVASGCVIAVPAPEIGPLFPQLDRERRQCLEAIDYPPGIVVALGLTTIPPEPSVVLLVPEREDAHLLGIALDHNKAPGRAPAGKGLITTWWRQSWSEKHWDSSDDEVVAAAIPTVAKILPQIGDNVVLTHVHRWKRCLMVTPPGRYAAVVRFRDITGESRVQFAGDWLASTGTNMALTTGERAAAQIIRCAQ